MGKCTDYDHHVNPLLFPDLPEKVFPKYRPTRKIAKGEHNDAIGPEQLTFDLQVTKK
jgi:hypothetical protein